MKRFKFRLQRVLDYRERIRDEKQGILQQKNYELQVATDLLGSLKAEALRDQISETAVYTADEMQLFGRYAQRLSDEIAWQEIKVCEAQEAADKAREAYIEASKDSKTLVKLKEKQRGEYDEHVLHEEIKIVDEMTVQRSKRAG